MIFCKRNSSVATLLLIIHVTMYNYQKSSLAHQVRIIQTFIRTKLYQIGISVFLFFFFHYLENYSYLQNHIKKHYICHKLLLERAYYLLQSVYTSISNGIMSI